MSIPLREFLQKWDDNHFDSTTDSMCEAGWYDWFCSSKSLYNRLKAMMPCVRRVAKSSKINQDTMYVFFKNNCPMWVNTTYDDFRICDMETGNVLWTITPKYPSNDLTPHRHYRGKRQIAYVNQVWDFTLSSEEYAGILIENLAQGYKIEYDECVVSGPRKLVYQHFMV